MSLWSRLRQSFWFVPALLCVAAVALAEGLILLEQEFDDADLGGLGVLVNRVGESGSRELLSAIAGSMLAVASTTFSITIAVLALSSSTYGPRLVRNFMADRGNQVVLGVFVATFLYSLMVLRSIRVIGDGSGDSFVPHLAVNVAVLLAVASIGVLVYFIHHISDSVQVWTLAEDVRVDLVDVVDRLYPDHRGGQGEEAGTGPSMSADGERADELGERTALTALETGYVQGMDVDSLLSLATKRDLVIAVEVRVGEHVTQDGVVALIRSTDPLGDDVLGSALGAFTVGRARTPQQDIEFSILLLEEMAVRALSPSTNDPYTAVNALDGLASGLVRLAGRAEPSPYRWDPDGRLRVIAPYPTLGDLLDHPLNAMRYYAITHPTVLHRTLDLITQVGEACEDAAVLLRLGEHTSHLTDAFAATSPQDIDLESLTRHAARVRERLLARAATSRPQHGQGQPPKT